MNPDQLILQEWRTEYGVPLSPTQRDLLIESPVVIRPSKGSDDHYDLTPGSEIGTIELPGLSVRVMPKLEIERVMFLISYALEGLEVGYKTSDYESHADIVEAVVAAFTEVVKRATRPSLLQGYRSEDNALMTVRGRIVFERQIRRFGISPPVEVRYDEFTVDIDENRVIKAALARLSRMRLRSDRSKRKLRFANAALQQVSLIEYGKRIPQIRFNRLNERYRPAILLAELILRSTSFDLATGRVSAPSFLIDMNRVFEDFVVHALRDELRLSESQFPQGMKGRRLSLDSAGRIKLKPDVSGWKGNRCLFVGDVKYKKTVDMRVPNADLYQLHAYTTATGVDRGVLVYAAGEDEPGVHVVRDTGTRLEIVALDLAGNPDELRAMITQLAHRIRQHAFDALLRGAA